MELAGLKGRGALLMGAGSSIGRCVAEALAREGARVHVADVNPEFVRKTLAEVPALSASVCDVGVPAQIEAAFADAVKRVGQVDFLVNLVGVPGPAAPLEAVEPAEWRQVIEINLNGIFEAMRHAIPGMKQRRFGAIVNFSTASTTTGLINRGPYMASKAAVEALTYSAARELGPFNVRCNAILPGPVNNERMNRILVQTAQRRGVSVAQVEEEVVRHVSMRARTEPQELADMVLYLCSDSGRHITGQKLEVSGNLEWEE